MSAAASCNSCGQTNWQPYLVGVLDYLTGQRFNLDRCASCGLIATHPVPAPHELDHFYPARYRGNRHGFTGRTRVALRCRAVESFFPRGFRGRLLDVGCGDGAFVLEMHRRGWKVNATEIDSATVERLCAAGITAKLPQTAEQDGFDEKFDAVTSWHVMEHVHQPLEVAKWVATQLKPDGIFQATVPNIASRQARIFGRQWLHLDVPRHLYHFSPSTFQALLKTAGFSPIHKSLFAWEYDWFGVIQSALNLICSRPNDLFERLTRARGQAMNFRSPLDAVYSCLLSPPLALLSLPPLLINRALGDGATLTLTCRLTANAHLSA